MKVKKIFIRTATSAFSLMVLATCFANPAGAKELAVMPDVKDMVLQNAIDTITALTDERDIVVDTQVTTGPPQTQLNSTNWIVCWQSPKAGNPIEEKTWVGVGVRRPNTKCYP